MHLSTHRKWERFFCRFLQMATIEVSVLYRQCSLSRLLAGTYRFRKFLLFFFLHKLTSISRQNWSSEEIPSSQNSDKAASFSFLVAKTLAYESQLAKHPVHNSNFVLLYTYRLAGEYDVIVRDSELIRLLESPRSLSVYIPTVFICWSSWQSLRSHREGIEQLLPTLLQICLGIKKH